MTSRIDVTAPATITVLAGSDTVASLDVLPPDGIIVADPVSGGTLTVQLIATNTGATLAASASGATITGTGNTLSVTGSAAQVNAALATLLITEPSSANTDTIRVVATDTAALSASSDIAIDVAANAKPGFASPPAILNFTPNSLSAVAGLIAGDPGATGDALAGEGDAQTLVLTLAAASGLLFLPGYAALDGIAASGLGTGTIQLTLTADRLTDMDSLIAGLKLAAPAANTGIAYALRDASDPTRLSATNGNITLDSSGAAGPNGSFAAGGGQSVILGAESFGAAITITGTLGDLGGLTDSGGIVIAPDAALNLPYNSLSLGGSSLDFGTLDAGALTETGTLQIAEGATSQKRSAWPPAR